MVTEGKLSCWNRDCREGFNENRHCWKDGVADASKCPNFVDSPWNEEMNKQ